MTQPDSIEALTRTLRADVEAIWEQIQTEQAELLRVWFELDPPQRLARLRALEQAVRDLADSVDDLAARHVATAMQGAYETGAWVTAHAAGVGAAFGTVDLDAILVLATDTMSDLLTATQNVRRSTKDLIRTLTRDHVRAKLYTGMTAEQAGVRLAAVLAREGITAITYADGRRVGLSTYTDMVVRTRTAEAYQTGGFNQGDELGVEWWEILDGTGCGLSSHDDPTKAAGMIVPTDVARAHPLSHPNCRRATTPRLDVTSAAEARRAKPTPTEQQRADQAAAEAARAAAYAAVPRRRTLDAQVVSRINLQDGVPPRRRVAAPA